MATPLLTTKLYIPAVRRGSVPRPRLIERLNAGLHRRLTLVSAPAGFGKTTLLSAWVASSGLPVAWVSLDRGDDDPAQFWSYVVAALQTVAPGIGEGVREAFRTPASLPVESLLASLINEIAALPRQGDHEGRPYVLVLDDYHLITAQPIHDVLAFLLDHLPPNLHLVISTRADPPLPLALLRGRDQLTELRLAHLRFTHDEAAAFLNTCVGLDLCPQDVAALEARTEGWIAGLQMATLAMQARLSMGGQEDVAGFVRAFAGSDRYVLDYLGEQVLQRQEEGVQAFMLRTSILDRLSGPLCDAVLGGEEPGREAPIDAQATLEYLERNNLFVVPLDNERCWYRYHRLFADLLCQRLHQAHPDLVPTLHRKASEWCEENGLMAEAIDHALSARDYERAADLVEREAEATLMRSEVATFLHWIESLPDELVRARLTLSVYHAWALLWHGLSPGDVESRLDDVSQDADLAPGKAAVLYGSVALFQGQLARATRLCNRALEQLAEDDVFLRSISTWILSVSEWVEGDIETSSRALDEIIRTSQKAGNVMIAVPAACHLARLNVRKGQTHQAREIYQRALELSTDRLGRRLPIASEALIGLGELAYEWNDLESAARYLEESIELGRQWSEAAALDAFLPLAKVRQAQGDPNGARDAIQRARCIALGTDAIEADDLLVALTQAQLWMTQGDHAAVMRWAEERGLTAGSDSLELEKSGDLRSHLRKYEVLVLARLLIEQETPGEALALLEPLQGRMERQTRTDLVIEIQVLWALACQAQGDLAGALTALEGALSLAEPGGFVRIFVDAGRPMARLLYEAAERGTAPAYTGTLLAAFPAETPLPPPGSPEMIEPLTGRELEVLALIAEGLSNQEIARRLVLSLSTVKWHTGNIYGKLAVKNRTQAVAKARALGVLLVS